MLGVSAEAEELYRRLVGGTAFLLDDPLSSDPRLVGAPRELLDAGLARIVTDGRPRLVAVSPVVAMEAALSRFGERLSGWQNETAETVRELSQLQQTYARTSSAASAHDAVQILTDPHMITELSNELLESAEAEMLAFNKTLDATSERSTNIASSAAATGSTFIIPNGEDVRLLPDLPLKLIIADRRAALVPLDETGLGGALLVRSPVLIGAFVCLFELLWERATPYRSTTDTGPLTPQEQRIVQLLAAGLTDEAIARQTNAAIRTVRRHITSIVDKLQVETRFAAGVQAAQRGWL